MTFLSYALCWFLCMADEEKLYLLFYMVEDWKMIACHLVVKDGQINPIVMLVIGWYKFYLWITILILILHVNWKSNLLCIIVHGYKRACEIIETIKRLKTYYDKGFTCHGLCYQHGCKLKMFQPSSSKSRDESFHHRHWEKLILFKAEIPDAESKWELD